MNQRHSGHEASIERFHLLRYFVGVSLVITVAITVVIAALWVKRADHDFAVRSTAQGSAEAGYLANMFYSDVWSPDQQPDATAALANVVDTQAMETFAGRVMMGLNIRTLTLLNVDGSFLWSSGPNANQGYVPDDQLYATVISKGTSASSLQNVVVADTAGQKHDMDLVRTLVPLRDTPPGTPLEGTLVGILGIDQDVTEELAKARSESLRFALLASGGTGVSLFILLFLIVLKADRTIDKGHQRILRHQSEQQKTGDALQLSNNSLEAALSELKDTQRQVVQQERLSALGQMASGIAHDFNNALTPILGFSELLLTSPQRLENPKTVKRYVQMINTAAGDAATVVRNLREFYRGSDETEVYDPVSLNDLIGQVISLTQAKWKDEAQSKGININLQTDLAEIPKVSGKESELREVLINLVFNSVDAMPDGGTIRFCTRLDDNHVAIQISDTGSGMTEEVRQRCFDPFFTTKGSQGTGMGLAMTFGIIKRLNGTIDIQSELGKGTIFTIRLPVYIEEAKKETEAAPVLQTKTQLRVLVIDDEPMVRELLAEYLTADGHVVESATNGREGLEKFHAGVFDLVITDRAMPEMNGEEVARAIKKETPSIPVVMLTGFGDLIKADGSPPPNINKVVSKPVDRLELQNIVNELSQ